MAGRAWKLGRQGMERMGTAPLYQRTLGERLRYLRRQRGWTQERLATQAGTNQAVIQKIENGKSLRPRKIDQIAAVLGVDPAWLVFGDDRDTRLSDEARELARLWIALPGHERARILAEIKRLNQDTP